MIWIVGFIILLIVGSLSSSTDTSNRSGSSTRNNNSSRRSTIETNSSLKSIDLDAEIQEVKDSSAVKAETYAEKHIRINKAIAEKKRLEALEKTHNQTSSDCIKQSLMNSETNFFINDKDVGDSNNLPEIIKTLYELNNIDAEFNREDCVSTTNLGRILGVKAKPELFDYLIEVDCLFYKDKRYILTDKGKNYGTYRSANENDVKFVVWNIDKITPLLKEFLENKIQGFDSIYHLTHKSNIESIFEKGLYCHSANHKYEDVSNNEVNLRREKIESCYGKKIHDYVPFYFNVKNAMLYAVQKKVETNVVVLEMNKMTACLPFTIFSDRNAATLEAKITNMKNDLKSFNWKEIYSDSWTENNIQNTSRMQLMMAECLILGQVPANFIKIVHCQDREIAIKISELARQYCLDINVKVTPQLFF